MISGQFTTDMSVATAPTYVPFPAWRSSNVQVKALASNQQGRCQLATDLPAAAGPARAPRPLWRSATAGRPGKA